MQSETVEGLVGARLRILASVSDALSWQPAQDIALLPAADSLQDFFMTILNSMALLLFSITVGHVNYCCKMCP